MEPERTVPERTPPRYGSTSLPARRYLPGLGPHPSDDPAHRAPVAPAVPWTSLGETELFRHGVDLFNHGFWWESHEAWEALWNACPRDAALREAFQGLIQLAAALIKEETRIPSGARRLSTTALEKLERAQAAKVPLPLDLGRVVAEARAHFARLDDPSAPFSPIPRLVIEQGPVN